MIARAWTDWLLDACQPAPASAPSTRTAKKPKTTRTTSQADQHPTEVGGRPRTEPRKWTGMGLLGLPIVTASAVDGASTTRAKVQCPPRGLHRD